MEEITVKEITDMAGRLRGLLAFSLSLGDKELFHSNVLAWFLERHGSGAFRQVADMFGMAGWNVQEVLRVEADFDLLAVCRSDSAPSARRFVVIENKFKSMPRREQLEEYRAKVSSGKVKAGRHDERLLRYAQIHACLRSRH